MASQKPKNLKSQALIPNEIFKIATSKAVEFWYSIEPQKIFYTENTFDTIPSWTKPPHSWMKLNIDGSMRDSLLGASGCIRNEHGSWVKGYAKFVGKGCTLQTELWAIYLGPLADLHVDRGGYPPPPKKKFLN